MICKNCSSEMWYDYDNRQWTCDGCGAMNPIDPSPKEMKDAFTEDC